MCGICGYNNPEEAGQETTIQAMAKSLAHRGPDAGGTAVFGATALGHRRLGILDLSKKANQPMASHDERYTVVYNGEIYNYRQLAKELGITQKTGSDTETIVNAYARLGAKLPERLNGMFAFAIYDRQEQNLFLCRDRMGIKPLYYYYKDGFLYFASELKSLMASDYVRGSTSLSSEAVNHYLHLGYIPGPMTIYNTIYSFPAGHYATYNKGKLDIKAYWALDPVRDIHRGSPEAMQEQLSGLLEDSVAQRLVSDVPYGCFLSGGTDSSLVAAIAARKSKDKLKTFTIGFEDTKHNEAAHAKTIAKHLGTEHHEYYLKEKDALSLIHDIVPTYDEPYADSSAIPTMLISRMARQEVKMVLSGDGGDELFHGYGAYRWAERLAKPHVRLLKKPAAIILSQMANRYKRAAKVLDYTGPHRRSHIFSQEQYLFSRREIEQLVTKEHKRPINLDESAPPHFSAAQAQALFDLRYYLPDDLLVKIDRASMKYGLETRVPILDHRIVEFSQRIPPEMKRNRNGDKWLLKQVLYQYLPAELFDRPKWGFSIPLDKWLRTELTGLRKHYLSEQVIRKHGLINYRKAEKIHKAYLSGKNYLYNRLWQLIILHIWLENNGH